MTFDSLRIVLPVYNEAENITRTLGEIKAKVTTPHQIFVIYDFDEDNTIPPVSRYIQDWRASHIFLLKNRYGRGALGAIKTGFDAINDGVVLVMMADSSDDLSVVDGMFEKINQGCDIVCGSRYMKGGSQVRGPRLKKFLARTGSASLHWLTGIPTHNVTNSFKMYRKSVLSDIKTQSRGGFEIGMEITVKAFLKGYKIAEVPSKWEGRTAGQSRFKLRKWLPEYLKWYLYALTHRLWRKGPAK